ncbi:MAG: leucine-rich repeat domain-containing protein [Gammaproteobacteria bacterium]|nr:MAG: leucine-rich repeat domain-containing protein [Gammaproteobacteria bacterium]UTW43506.1 leucine-rich repeat domain-containing protein [bacterium SCSIO 12844]
MKYQSKIKVISVCILAGLLIGCKSGGGGSSSSEPIASELTIVDFPVISDPVVDDKPEKPEPTPSDEPTSGNDIPIIDDTPQVEDPVPSPNYNFEVFFEDKSSILLNRKSVLNVSISEAQQKFKLGSLKSEPLKISNIKLNIQDLQSADQYFITKPVEVNGNWQIEIYPTEKAINLFQGKDEVTIQYNVSASVNHQVIETSIKAFKLQKLSFNNMLSKKGSTQKVYLENNTDQEINISKYEYSLKPDSKNKRQSSGLKIDDNTCQYFSSLQPNESCYLTINTENAKIDEYHYVVTEPSIKFPEGKSSGSKRVPVLDFSIKIEDTVLEKISPIAKDNTNIVMHNKVILNKNGSKTVKFKNTSDQTLDSLSVTLDKDAKTNITQTTCTGKLLSGHFCTIKFSAPNSSNAHAEIENYYIKNDNKSVFSDVIYVDTRIDSADLNPLDINMINKHSNKLDNWQFTSNSNMKLTLSGKLLNMWNSSFGRMVYIRIIDDSQMKINKNKENFDIVSYRFDGKTNELDMEFKVKEDVKLGEHKLRIEFFDLYQIESLLLSDEVDQNDVTPETINLYSDKVEPIDTLYTSAQVYDGSGMHILTNTEGKVELNNVGYKQLNNSDIVIPYGVTSINSGVFLFRNTGTTITSVVIPDTVIEIGEAAFYGNQLTFLTLPDSVIEIKDATFSYNNLNEVYIPNSVTHIQAYAFEGNNLTSVVIPSSVSKIGYKAFAANNNLDNFTILNSEANVALDQNGIFGSAVSLNIQWLPQS